MQLIIFEKITKTDGHLDDAKLSAIEVVNYRIKKLDPIDVTRLELIKYQIKSF